MTINNFHEEELTGQMQETLNSAKSFVLSASEKSQLRDTLTDHIKSGVIISDFRKEEFNAKLNNNRKSFIVHDLFGLSKQVYLMPALALVLVFLGSGTSYLAKSSLPGDALYPVKTEVNENIESLMALSPEAQADVALKQVTERLTEIDTLKSSGADLTEVQTLTIQSNFSKKVEYLNKSIVKVKKKGNDKKAKKVNTDFEREIDKHYDAFVTISGSASNSPTFAGIFASRNTRYGDTNVMAMSGITARSTKSGDNDHDDDDSVSTMSIQALTFENSSSSDVISTTTISHTSTTTSSTTISLDINLKTYTLLDVSKHASSTNCWSVLSGGVYDLTKWITPKLTNLITIKDMCGVDASILFFSQYKAETKPLEGLSQYKIGIIK